MLGSVPKENLDSRRVYPGASGVEKEAELSHEIDQWKKVVADLLKNADRDTLGNGHLENGDMIMSDLTRQNGHLLKVLKSTLNSERKSKEHLAAVQMQMNRVVNKNVLRGVVETFLEVLKRPALSPAFPSVAQLWEDHAGESEMKKLERMLRALLECNSDESLETWRWSADVDNRAQNVGCVEKDSVASRSATSSQIAADIGRKPTTAMDSEEANTTRSERTNMEVESDQEEFIVEGSPPSSPPCSVIHDEQRQGVAQTHEHGLSVRKRILKTAKNKAKAFPGEKLCTRKNRNRRKFRRCCLRKTGFALANHRQKGRIKCGMCDEITENRSEFMRHVWKEHKEHILKKAAITRRKTKRIGKRFSTAASRTPKAILHGMPPQSGPSSNQFNECVCGKRFRQKLYLDDHIRHNASRQYKGCTKSNPRKSSSEKIKVRPTMDEGSESGRKPADHGVASCNRPKMHSCICQHTFSSRKKLLEHIRHYKAPFQCDVCMRKFIRSETLQRHRDSFCKPSKNGISSELRKTSSKTESADVAQKDLKGKLELVPCPDCDAGFTSEAAQRQHEKETHSPNLASEGQGLHTETEDASTRVIEMSGGDRPGGSKSGAEQSTIPYLSPPSPMLAAYINTNDDDDVDEDADGLFSNQEVQHAMTTGRKSPHSFNQRAKELRQRNYSTSSSNNVSVERASFTDESNSADVEQEVKVNVEDLIASINVERQGKSQAANHSKSGLKTEKFEVITLD